MIYRAEFEGVKFPQGEAELRIKPTSAKYKVIVFQPSGRLWYVCIEGAGRLGRGHNKPDLAKASAQEAFLKMLTDWQESEV